jgi:hypothetical protein
MEDRHEGKRFRERHITTNMVILTLDDETAEVTAEAAIFQTPDGGSAELEMTGRYIDQLVKWDGRWLFARRSFLTDGKPRKIV